MARKKSKRSSARKPVRPPNLPSPKVLKDASQTIFNDAGEYIEEVRTELMTIYGVLMVLKDVLMYSEDEDAISHSNCAKVSARLLDDVVTNLEVLKNQLEKNRGKAS